jgi:hypothetical protein
MMGCLQVFPVVEGAQLLPGNCLHCGQHFWVSSVAFTIVNSVLNAHKVTRKGMVPL